MNPLTNALGWALLHCLWQGALVVAAVALALWALEGYDSRLRYAVACAGLVLLTAAPVATFFVLWEPAQPCRPAPAQASVPAQPRAVRMVQAMPAAPSAAPAPAAIKAHPAGRIQAWTAQVDAVLPWLLLLWAAGSLVMSMRLAGGWAWLQWLRRRPETEPAPDAEQLLLLRLCQRMGVGSNLRLLLCRSVRGPTVLGWLRPVILMPPVLVTGLNPLQLELILAHELAHVLRQDYLVNLLQSIAEVLFFFHPAMWWLSARIRQEREQACDDLAVRRCSNPLDYAQALTALEAFALRPKQPGTAPQLALGARGGDFVSRIHRLIFPSIPTGSLVPRAGLVLPLLLGGAFAISAQTIRNPPFIWKPKPAPAHAAPGRFVKGSTLGTHGWIPPDGAMLGSKVGNDALPIYQVTMAKDIRMGKASVTQARWEEASGTFPLPRVSGEAIVEVNAYAPRSIVTDLHHLDRDMGPDPYTELDPLPPPTLVRCYITRMHHQDRDMGPNPYTEIEPLPPITWVDGFPVRGARPRANACAIHRAT